MKIGVLGGTFDPVHKGHITIAEEARSQLALTEVIFVPAAQTPLKEYGRISPVEHRVRMVRLAIADYPYFRLSTVEAERSGPSYTADTVVEMKTKLGVGDELFFIIGLGSLAQFPLWREPSRIIQTCQLVAVSRPGYAVPDLNSLEAAIPGISRRLIMLDKPEIDISATEIRERVARGLSVRHLVAEPVAEYIEQNGLYSSEVI
jgi:nicotinate-nucleotide adenylyltransferase